MADTAEEEGRRIATQGAMNGEQEVKVRNAAEAGEEESRPYAAKTAPQAELYASIEMSPDQWHRAVLNGIWRTPRR